MSETGLSIIALNVQDIIKAVWFNKVELLLCSCFIPILRVTVIECHDHYVLLISDFLFNGFIFCTQPFTISLSNTVHTEETEYFPFWMMTSLTMLNLIISIPGRCLNPLCALIMHNKALHLQNLLLHILQPYTFLK